ncbi:Fc receptor-like protein 5 isoform X3 [Cervus canadensis]|uniref:Fc receptor-like protein 5 isoform X3 n=1 Tax=Cervus canadensis TaxID=1574408 RepID=UPI001C9E686C|nr:Fc receptor-like protein 5 isoform X3 [Cervus canadensis]
MTNTLFLRKLLFWPQPWADQVFMLLWVSLLILAPVSGQFATEVKSVISLHPPWTTLFQGETATLICKALQFNAAQKIKWYRWYLPGEIQTETTQNTYEVRESGGYKCQAQDSHSSDRVDLIFSAANLILQAPFDVFEEDSVVLRCQAKANIVLTNMTLYKNGKILETLNKTSDFHIHQASMKDNGEYHCSGVKDNHLVSSNKIKIIVQELFPSPVLRASSTQPTERDAVTLTCETQLSQQRPEGQLLFRFVKQSNNVGSDWKNSPEFQFSPIRKENSGSYWCEAQRVNSRVQKRSQELQIQVQEIVQIHYYPEFVFEGQELVLICSVNGATKPITVSWYKKQDRLQKDIELQTSSKTEFTIPVVQNSDAGEYYCIARNSRFSKQSNSVIISVKVPVSQPVLTLRPPGTWNLVTDKMSLQCEVQRGSLPIWYQFFHEVPVSKPVLTFSSPGTRTLGGIKMSLQCEVQRGSLPIWYQFFREGVLLKKREAISWRTVSYSFSVTGENSGNYYCTADNGFGPQRSEAMSLSVTVPVSQPVLSLSPPGTRTLVGNEVRLQCEVQRGSLPIWYQFFLEDVLLTRTEATSWRTKSYSFSVTGENSGNYYCTADNGFGPQRSEAMSLSVIVPVSQPVFSLSPRGTQTLVGNEVRLQCEVQRGSLPIWYQFFLEDVLLTRTEATSWRTVSYSFSVTGENSGNYYCTADNGFGPQRSESINLSVIVPVSRPVLTLRAPRVQAVVGDVVELHCEAQRGSPPILYQFYHEDVTLGSSSSPSGGGASFNLILKAEHSGNYFCEANNGQGVQRSHMVPLSVRVPVSHPVLTLRTPRVQAVVGDVLEIHCESQRGSPPIQYQFYHEDVALGNSSSLSGGGTSFHLSLTTEHSGNYSCEADNGLGVQRSEAVSLNVRVPVSRPVLTLRTARTQVVVGDVLELRCEAQRGSPQILYWFYHNNVTLETSTSHSGQGVSLNLLLTADHSGTYSCKADNGLGPQHSEAVTLSVMGLTGSKSSLIATSVTGGLLSMMAIAAVAVLFYCWLLRKAGRKPTFDSSRNPSAPDPQESTYHNVPGWIELQPVYSNVNPNRGEVVYSEVWSVKKENKVTAASEPELFKNTDSCVIYAQVKGASTAASKPQFLDPFTPHR